MPPIQASPLEHVGSRVRSDGSEEHYYLEPLPAPNISTDEAGDARDRDAAAQRHFELLHGGPAALGMIEKKEVVATPPLPAPNPLVRDFEASCLQRLSNDVSHTLSFNQNHTVDFTEAAHEHKPPLDFDASAVIKTELPNTQRGISAK